MSIPVSIIFSMQLYFNPPLVSKELKIYAYDVSLTKIGQQCCHPPDILTIIDEQ